MPDLSDNEVHSLLHDAARLFDGKTAETPHGQTAIETMTQVCLMMQLAILSAQINSQTEPGE